MAKPWTKKNPASSMFLTGANTWAGAARGPLTKEIRRQQATAVANGAKQVAGFWAAALTPSASSKKRKPRR